MKIRVYYEDTDCGGVVYYANYLRYMERGRTEFLRERGISLVELRARGIQFAVVETNVKYRAPAVYDDLLDVESAIIDRTSITVTFRTTIRNPAGTLLVSGDVRLACLDAAMKACRMPSDVAEIMKRAAHPESGRPIA
jgi:acyl-CoA thioester hydrolase